MAKKISKVPTRFFMSKDDFQLFVEEEKEWMYDRIVKAITEAFSRGIDEAHIFDAKIEESMTVISMNSSREEWVNSLQLAIEWYSMMEMYERCAEILKLINKIKTSRIDLL